MYFNYYIWLMSCINRWLNFFFVMKICKKIFSKFKKVTESDSERIPCIYMQIQFSYRTVVKKSPISAHLCIANPISFSSSKWNVKENSFIYKEFGLSKAFCWNHVLHSSLWLLLRLKFTYKIVLWWNFYSKYNFQETLSIFS